MTSERVRAKLPPKALEHARGFLSALFMGLRTAQIHDTSNAAFHKAVDTVHRTAEALFASTGGFQVQFVDESCFLNGVRLRFEGGGYQSMRSLRHLLESQELGGITMEAHPTQQSVRTLIQLFAKSMHGEERVSKEDVQRAQIGILGVQRFADGNHDFHVDRRVFAVQSYAKLLLALREQYERAQTAQAADWATNNSRPRLRVVRVIQDLVELCGDRADFVLRLALNVTGAPRQELYAANTCLLSLALGHSLGFQRQDLVDIGVAALFHPVGFEMTVGTDQVEVGHVHASLARMFQESGVGRSSHLRAVIVAECLVDPDPDRAVHPFSRVVRVAAQFVSRVIGYPNVDPIDPLEALGALADDPARYLDARIADLLVNILRAYPEGTEVVLDSGKSGVVMSHLGGSRWDRPLVRVADDDGARNFDLMVQEQGRFVDRVAGTTAFMGQAGAAMRMLDEMMLPPVLDPADLVLEEEPELLAVDELLEVPAVPGEAIDALVTPVELSATDLIELDTIDQPRDELEFVENTDKQEVPLELDLEEEEAPLELVPIGDAFDFGDIGQRINTDVTEMEPGE